VKSISIAEREEGLDAIVRSISGLPAGIVSINMAQCVAEERLGSGFPAPPLYSRGAEPACETGLQPARIE
jgi:hypothetical protein